MDAPYAKIGVMLSSPFIFTKTHPRIRKTKDAITVACFIIKGTFFSTNLSFSGMIFKPSKAPAFSSSSMVASPCTVSFEAPKFTTASETPSRCFTFFSNFVAQPAQVNPCTR
jgi:hypothetical protein